MAEAKMTLLDWLDDLTVRFLLNLPQSELSSVPRLCFQVEEAHWFYEDFIRPLAAAAGNQLPNLPLRQFCLLLFQHCPLLSGFSDDEHIAAYEEFLAYKVRVPVRGAILLDASMEQVLLVRGWKKGSSWSFPRGKINKDEPDLDCAIREVWEETGYDLRASGLIARDESMVKHIDIIMREQHMRLFVFRDVPLDTVFETQTRKEISKIQWYNLRALPGFARKGRQDVDSSNANKYYMVAPFLGPLKKWIAQQRRNDLLNEGAVEDPIVASLTVPADDFTAEESEGPAEMAAVADTRDRSEELRRMLSIGGSSLTEQTRSSLQTQATQADKLLAMLQGPQMNRNIPPPPPTLPLNRTEAGTQNPQLPVPHHPRQPSVDRLQRAPQFPVPHPGQHRMPPFYEAQQMQPPHAHQSSPALIQQLHQRVGYHAMDDGKLAAIAKHGQPHPLGPQLPLHPSNARSEHRGLIQPWAQGPGAIAAVGNVPSASQLPTPSLNAHAASLLDAFTSGSRASPQAAQPRAASVSANQQQAALLGLLKQAPASAQVPPPGHARDPTVAATSPTLSDVTIKARTQPVRKTTLNEITRTLPQAKRPSQPSPIPSGTPPSVVLPSAAAATSLHQRSVPASVPRPPVGSANGSHIPPQANAGGIGNGAALPAFKILSRSEHVANQSTLSSTGLAAVVHNAQSHNTTNHATNGMTPVPTPSSSASVGTSVLGQQDRLLSLLKRPVAQSTAPAGTSGNTPAPTHPPATTNKASLLDLFGAKPPPPRSNIPTIASQPPPPPAPLLQPESRSTKATPTPIYTNQGNNLLDLFRKSSPSAETPISPFALGSPEQARHVKLPSRSKLGDAGPDQSKGRLGSVSSSGRGTPTVTTPTEAKDFLLGYLNGVVQKEGLGRK